MHVSMLITPVYSLTTWQKASIFIIFLKVRLRTLSWFREREPLSRRPSFWRMKRWLHVEVTMATSIHFLLEPPSACRKSDMDLISRLFKYWLYVLLFLCLSI